MEGAFRNVLKIETEIEYDGNNVIEIENQFDFTKIIHIVRFIITRLNLSAGKLCRNASPSPYHSN